MKIIFLFFTALNIAFFLWQSSSSGTSPGAVKGQLVQDQRVPTLVLLREAEAAKNSDSQKVQTAITETPKKAGKKYQACYSVGPFDQLTLIKSVSNQMQELGADLSQRKETRQVVLGHWVFLPSFPTWQDARKKVTELEAKGIKDIFILGRGEMKNAISLGLFKQEESAKRRLANLKKIGVEPSVETQQTNKEFIWLDVYADSNEQQVRSVLEAVVGGDGELQLQTRDCGTT